MGFTFAVDRIYWQDAFLDYSDEYAAGCWFQEVEFLDPAGQYHFWKQRYDGGEIIWSTTD